MPEQKEKILSLFREIQNGNKLAFNELFLMYYPKLLTFAKQYTKNQESAEEITSELFVKIWIKRAGLFEILNPEVYLFIAIKNACLNLIRSEKKRSQFFHEELHQSIALCSDDDGLKMENQELKKQLDLAVKALPEQRKLIFKLIKEDGLKAQEVALILNISVRTVENQLYKAVKALAEAISDYIGYHPQKRISKKQALSDLPLLFFL
ncbi:RNA polymerase sigma-70 factor [Pedobacter insulae]|uniref:RNA polymerase sigma-70 factor, ECF subfamily n=1 Tax=Pedobacter insulae TaxID=414048 RepID=A0A1I2ZQC1_9SPHI|nr:RNA polymerase sigma-70 factor [Pedobacter insulae]SFH40033.1 RNA polymerase sigma-70 factor, ECF subfamily [Pedobacter insulae]